jgi:hypothetical protein
VPPQPAVMASRRARRVRMQPSRARRVPACARRTADVQPRFASWPAKPGHRCRCPRLSSSGLRRRRPKRRLSPWPHRRGRPAPRRQSFGLYLTQ